MGLKMFKNKNFSLFVFGQSTSLLGTGFLNVALALYVLEITGSAGKFASILALGVIPNILLGPIAGAVVDKVNRKKMIISLDFIRGVFAVLLFVYSLFATINVWVIYLIVLFYGTCQIFFTPAFITILPSVVKKEELVDANSLQKTVEEITYTVAPFFGAALFGLYGIGVILLLDGITYLVSALSEVFMNVPPLERDGKESSFLKDVMDGFKVILIDVRITSLISNGVLTHIFLFPFAMVGFPYIIVTLLGGTEVDYGVVQSIATIGSILPIVAVTFAKKRFNVAQNIGIGIIGMIVFVISMLPLSSGVFLNLLEGNSPFIVLFFSAMIFIFYLSFGFYGVFYVTFYQGTIPGNKLGRYVAVQSLFFSLGRLLGFKFYGYLFDNYSLIIPITILGIGMLLKVIVHIPFMKETKKLEELELVN